MHSAAWSPGAGGRPPGAFAVPLTDKQVERLKEGKKLWVQGGTPDDPVLDKLAPSTYAFGALRCTVDNVNGDNVEFLAFPEGSRHVFCFAYYVVPPPTSGTIIVRKTGGIVELLTGEGPDLAVIVASPSMATTQSSSDPGRLLHSAVVDL